MMKKITFIKSIALTITFLLAFAVNAQNIITIDNSPQSTTTLQTLQEALDAAVAGDHIYLQPTATSYGNGIIDKAITIVGRSHSEVNGVSNAGTLTVRSSGVTIKGINFSSLVTNPAGPTPPPYTGLRVYECEIGGMTLGTSASATASPYMDDIEIRGCVIGGINQRVDAINILIGNNIIRGGITFYAPETVVIANNIFRSGSGNITLSNFSATATAILYNNMFKTNAAANRTINMNSGIFNFSNCLTYNYGGGTLTFATSGNASFLDNNTLLNTDPLFVDVDSSVTTSLAGASSIYDPAARMDDLTLQATSPALTGGGGGEQIGIFNSGFNYKYIGNPRGVPTLDIINYDAAVPKNGTINVTIKAKAH